jgi:signal transduction histidine kinase
VETIVNNKTLLAPLVAVRRYDRLSLNIPVRVFQGEGKITSGRAHEISEAGMAIYVPLELTIGASVYISFQLTYSEFMFDVHTIVRNCNGFRYGVEFVNVTETEAAELKRITAILKMTDVAREQQVKLERLAIAGQMAAKIAHEISNPLETVTNVLYLLGNLALDEEARKYVSLAQEQIGRVVAISKQTLSFYRDSHTLTPVNLRHATDNVVAAASVTFAAARKRINFVVDVPGDLKVNAIDSEVVQILTNLVANAVHYSPESETVRIAALRRNGDVEIFVSDSGPGVSPEHSSKLFQPFFTTNKVSGNGLGLWISRELARRADGDIMLVPSNEGATFKLLLKPVA